MEEKETLWGKIFFIHNTIYFTSRVLPRPVDLQRFVESPLSLPKLSDRAARPKLHGPFRYSTLPKFPLNS